MYDFGREDISGVEGTNDVVDAEPVGQTEYRAEIARILVIVLEEYEFTRGQFKQGFLREDIVEGSLVEEGEHLAW